MSGADAQWANLYMLQENLRREQNISGVDLLKNFGLPVELTNVLHNKITPSRKAGSVGEKLRAALLSLTPNSRLATFPMTKYEALVEFEATYTDSLRNMGVTALCIQANGSILVSLYRSISAAEVQHLQHILMFVGGGELAFSLFQEAGNFTNPVAMKGAQGMGTATITMVEDGVIGLTAKHCINNDGIEPGCTQYLHGVDAHNTDMLTGRSFGPADVYVGHSANDDLHPNVDIGIFHPSPYNSYHVNSITSCYAHRMLHHSRTIPHLQVMGLSVVKYGISTLCTKGRISNVGVTTFTVEATQHGWFATMGDSGSLIVGDDTSSEFHGVVLGVISMVNGHGSAMCVWSDSVHEIPSLLGPTIMG